MPKGRSGALSIFFCLFVYFLSRSLWLFNFFGVFLYCFLLLSLLCPSGSMELSIIHGNNVQQGACWQLTSLIIVANDVFLSSWPMRVGNPNPVSSARVKEHDVGA